eukprot:g21754.t1
MRPCRRLLASVSDHVWRFGAGRPRVAVLGGVHGNELAGVEDGWEWTEAASVRDGDGQVVRTLVQELSQAPQTAGEVTLIIGNPPAVAQATRYIEEDLNRCFDDVPLRGSQVAPAAAGGASKLLSNSFCSGAMTDEFALRHGPRGATGPVAQICYEAGLASDASVATALLMAVRAALTVVGAVEATHPCADPLVSERKSTRAWEHYEITEIFRLDRRGFRWLPPYGAYNFQPVPSGAAYSARGESEGELLVTREPSYLVFPKVPERLGGKQLVCVRFRRERQFYTPAKSGQPMLYRSTWAGLGCGNPLVAANLRPGEVVLDLGSGAGIDCFLAGKQVGPSGRVIGPRTIQRIAESLQQLGPGGTVEREVLLETLRRLVFGCDSARKLISSFWLYAKMKCMFQFSEHPGSIESAWTDADLTKILQAAGLPENEPISCSAFTSWLFDLTDLPGTTSAPHPAVSRKTSTERYPRLHEIPEVHRIGNEMSLDVLAFHWPRQTAKSPRLRGVDVELARTVEFLTDVEGNWEYFVHFVSWSQVLGWSGLDRGLWGPGELQLAEHGYLVFGGDAVDKGSGDIRVVKTLLELKRRYWDRVFIVLGNRDICKLRFYAELQPGEDGGSFERRGGAYWIPDPKPSPDYETYLQMHHLERGHVSTVRWVLDCNMGCQQTTFNTRRHELALLGLPATDEAVVDSYRDSVDPSHPDCWMLDFLRVGQLAVILGDALFIHGGLYDDCLGRVPEETASTANMREWAARASRQTTIAKAGIAAERSTRCFCSVLEEWPRVYAAAVELGRAALVAAPTGQPCSVFDLDAGHCTVLEPSCVERRLPELPTQLSRPLRARLSRLRAKAGDYLNDAAFDHDAWIAP